MGNDYETPDLSKLTKVTLLKLLRNMPHGKHLSPEQKFLRTTYLAILSLAKPMETNASWYLTGTGAVTGLLMSNIQSVLSIVSQTSFKYGVICFVVSMVCGAVTKGIGMSIQNKILTTDGLITYLNSEEGAAIMNEMTISKDKLMEEIKKPFVWPISWAMKNSSGGDDYIKVEKGACRQLCMMTRWLIAQQILLVSGLLIILLAL